jgi:hypothetical protein
MQSSIYVETENDFHDNYVAEPENIFHGCEN